MSVATKGVGVDGSAVIATRPANAPLSAMVKSALPKTTLAVIKATITPPVAAALVFKNTMATLLALATSANLSTEPPLKPNHPIHKINVPKVANGRFAPGIALTLPSLVYLPFRAPSNNTPANAAAAPAKCTIPDPAKSENPNSFRLYRPNTSLPPQVHEPSIG